MRLNTLSITARDITGQKRYRASDIPGDYSVGDVVDGLLPRMSLNRLDQNGSPIKFEARLDREGRHLNRAEIVGEVLQDEDEVVLHPRIMAGGLRPK
jgi:hypothetical protein